MKTKTIYLIRHFKTKGNIEKRYVGKTDESVLPCCFKKEFKGKYSFVDVVFSSPLKRCIETALFLCEKKDVMILDDLRETDFGDFEYKNYDELKNDRYYNMWLQSGGNISFPNGEDILCMKKRCIDGYNKVLKYMEEMHFDTSAVICHGGTIMAIMEYLKGDFYYWQCENGAGVKLIVNNSHICAEKLHVN